nr:hypothetical protein Iba_scaffold51369CG0020 [Ipomoea batatas]
MNAPIVSRHLCVVMNPCEPCIKSSSAPLNRNITGLGGTQSESIVNLANSSIEATHEPQSPAPGEPGVVSKWPFTSTDGSLSPD